MKKINCFSLLFIVAALFSFSNTNAQQAKSLHFKSGKIIPELNSNQLEKHIVSPNELVNGSYFRIIQFSEIPTSSQKESLINSGITLLDYMPDYAFYASILENTNLNVLKQYNVISVLPIAIDFKLTRQLKEKNYPHWTLFGFDQIELNTMYFSTISKIQAENKLRKLGATILVSNDVQIINFRINLSKLEEVYTQSEFYYFEQIDEPGQPENFRSRTNSRSNTISTEYAGGIKFDGTGMTVMLQDDGIIGPHIDYTGRIDLRVTSNSGNHGDHTSGTIMSAGNLNPRGRGMASGADLLVYGSDNANYNLVPNLYNNEDVVITSKSYSNGCNAGYTSLARQLDQQIRQLPSLIHVFSAGNSGASDCGYGAGAGWGNITGGHKVGKNVVTVGNLSYTDVLAGSSSRGPAEDGRIKPDVCAVGTNVFSTMDVNDYQTISGTSMACPGVAGVFTQLYHAYKTMNSGNNPLSGLMKGIVLNTCDEVGNSGPDYKYGWGRINARRAYEVMSNNQYLSSTIAQGGNNSHVIAVPANTAQVRIMVYWTDYEAVAGASVALVNNLNMQVVDPSSSTFNPWVLDPTPNATSLNNVAVRGIDNLNNMEQVTIDNPTAGNFTVNVNGFAIPQGPQEYFVIYEFISNNITLTYPIGGEGLAPGTIETIRWDAFSNTGNFAVEYSINNGVSWLPVNMNVNGAQRYFDWNVPNQLSGLTKVRVTRGVYNDESDQVFSIIGTPTNLQVNWSCPDSLNFSWNAVTGATGYEVSMLGVKYMDSVGTTSNTNITLLAQSIDTVWLSVRSLGPNNARGERAIAIQRLPGTFSCPIPVDVAMSNSLPQNNTSILSCMTPNFAISIDVLNDGLNTLTNIPVNYTLNGGTSVTENIAGPIVPGASVNHVFATQPTPVSGTNNLLVWASMVGDGNPFNDTLISQFNYNTSAPKTLPWTENFETFSLCGTSSNCEAEICAMNNDFTNLANGIDDDIDWRTDNGGTPSTGTGPSQDFNPGTSSGKYLYLEPSGAPVCSSKEAILLSPCIDLTGTNNPVLNFAYNMNGTTMGALFVDVFSNGVWNVNLISPLVGNKGANWFTATASLNAYVGNVINIRFRGVTGSSWESDLAIDDISITQTVGISENAFTGVSIYPNPVNKQLIVSGLTENDITTLTITDVTGKIITTSTTSLTNQQIIDASGLSTGIYFLQLTSPSGSRNIKFVKE